MSYSKDYRKAVISYTLKETNKIFKVSESAIKSWIKQYRKTGTVKEKSANLRGHRKIDPKQLELYIKEHPDAYLREFADYFNCSAEEIRKALKRLKITRKKRDRILRTRQ